MPDVNNELPEDDDIIIEDDDESEEDDMEDPSDVEANLPVAVDVDNVQLPAAWASTSHQVDQVRRHMKMFGLKHGMLANVPMVCRNTQCPLAAVCSIPQHQRPTGDRCPIEIAAIIDGYDKYTHELGLTEEDYFDRTQVRDLVDIEVKLLRTRGVLASAEHFIEWVAIGTDSSGKLLEAPQLHKATDYEERLLNRKAKIMSDLNSTRKQREKNKVANDPSSFASNLMQRAVRARAAMDAKRVDVIDVEAEVIPDTISEKEE